MDNNVFKEFQKLDRKRVYEIRRHGQDGSSVNLPKDEKRLADIMLEHDKEYGNQFEMADLLENYECDINKDHHDHFVCEACGKIIEFHNDKIEALQEAVAKEHGFTLSHHRMELYGTCSDCINNKAEA